MTLPYTYRPNPLAKRSCAHTPQKKSYLCYSTNAKPLNGGNKRHWHERLCPENKILHLMFYFELKLYWMKVCWLYERSWEKKNRNCIKKKGFLTILEFVVHI